MTTRPHTPDPDLLGAGTDEEADAGRRCVNCARPLHVSARVPNKRFCSDRCRKADWQRRNDRSPGGIKPAEPQANAAPEPTGTVGDTPNAVPSTPDAVPGPALGQGRCPHCSQHIAIINMLITPAAAHVTLPAPPPGHRP